MVVGFVLSTALTLIVQEHLNARRAQAEIRNDEVAAFLVAANRFDTLAQLYVGVSLEEDERLKQVREDLLANMQEQNALLDQAENYLNPTTVGTAEVYRSELVDLANAIHTTADVPGMRVFWEEMSDVLVARSTLIETLRQASGRKTLQAPTNTA